MTPEAKSLLSKTIRSLRSRLLADLRSSCDSAYQFAIRNIKQANLDDALATRRRRIEAWLDEQVRSEVGRKHKRTADDFRLELEKQAAYTLLNRLIILRLMEAGGLRYGRLASEGWNSDAYKTFRQLAPALIQDDTSEGFAFLLQLVFEDLAVDMPGLFGPAGVAELIPVPPATLRAVIEALADPRLESCWTDDMTLGWVYQYWNDPEREALDAKINAGGKIEPHEIASKTQMFTERYMVDWLLQNSLGPMWLAMCKKHGWVADAESTGTLDELERRRVEWRAKRDAGEVELTELMPLHSDLERQWAYYVPQPIPENAVEQAPESVRDLRILDPAVGSGHFLVAAFDLLVALYREEVRHRGESGDETKWSDRAIVEQILKHNLHGIDLDPRAVQIAAAALWLKAHSTCREAQLQQLNLVASNLRLASLPHDDPALVELRRAVEQETGMPSELTDTIVQALRGADHLGSLLQVDKTVDEAIRRHETEVLTRKQVRQLDLFGRSKPLQKQVDFDAMATRRTLLEELDVFLSRHTSGEDLGLRTRGEQLAAGVRFMRLVKEGSYDLVVANPPYQGTSKMADASYIAAHYPLAKADLYAAFLLRGLQLVRENGVSAMLTMRSWMFIKQYARLRQYLLDGYDLRTTGDLSSGGFQEINPAQVVVSVAMTCFWRMANLGGKKVAIRSFDAETVLKPGETDRKRAATLCHIGRHDFDPNALKDVPEWPLVYWWDDELLRAYQSVPNLGTVAPALFGATTGDNTRYVRRAWEVDASLDATVSTDGWVPYINGAKGRAWIEDLNESMLWKTAGLPYRVFCERSTGANFRNPSLQFHRGVAFSMIGAIFSARVHRYPSVFGDMGSSVFPDDLAGAVCAMNSTRARETLASLNPSVLKWTPILGPRERFF